MIGKGQRYPPTVHVVLPHSRSNTKSEENADLQPAADKVELQALKARPRDLMQAKERNGRNVDLVDPLRYRAF